LVFDLTINIMGYQIKAYYQTGDSFGSENTYTVLELINKDIDVAKANLKRIAEHYEMYKQFNSYSRHREKTKKDYKNFDWFVDEDMFEYSVILKTDSGNNLQIHCDWCGYFEKLHSIELVNDEEFKIEF
jgi:hypothetical protein